MLVDANAGQAGQGNGQSMTFEQAFETLQNIVRQLEEGQISLDEAVTLYETGRMLIAQCETRLDAAELRVSQVAPE